MKKVFITIIIVAILIGSYFYYTKRLKPGLFASSFFKELEYKGYKSYKLSDYLFYDFDITPSKTWDESYEEFQRDSASLSKEERFIIWSEVYLSRCLDYGSISPEYPEINIMSIERFKDVYENFVFFDFNIKYKEFEKDKLTVSGDVEVKYKNSSIGNSMFGGKQKFTLIMANGSLGWKVTIFSLDI